MSRDGCKNTHHTNGITRIAGRCRSFRINTKKERDCTNAPSKGLAAERLVEADLILAGFTTFLPSSAQCVYDILAERGELCFKIQVKAATPKNGRLVVDARRPSASSRHYSMEDYDYLAVVDLSTRLVCYIPRKSFNTGRVTVRLTKSAAPRTDLYFSEYRTIKGAV
ncbi:group I intron-associated PD-(D/E)XK endonuclease [Paenibacillus cisolokensis]|uniref:group I intron-associated PD-(D/E)XK endonuclease n=1 Tax=Paenibacillus cisolokensis TaxID=1658519 RepID=UPI003558CD7D